MFICQMIFMKLHNQGGISLNNLKRIKQQIVNKVALYLAESYYISLFEAKHAVNLSEFRNNIEFYNEHELKALLVKNDYNTIISDIWSEYSLYYIA